MRFMGKRRDGVSGEVRLDLGGVVEEGAGGAGQGLDGGGEGGVVLPAPGGGGGAGPGGDVFKGWPS
ncbi:hypothetical protein PL81_31720 [Streptomyces sp. RSD-27]|nr:hypothetical protein PL81_31720 [Streptomyces sp. RSD-27]